MARDRTRKKTKITATEDAALDPATSGDAASSNAANVGDATAPDSFKNKKNVMWVILSGAMAITFIVMMFLPDSGTGSGALAVYSAMLWCGIFGAATLRYLGKNGWYGFFAGSVVGMLLQIISTVVKF